MSFVTMADEITLESLTEELFECFIEYYRENYLEDSKSDLENLEEVYKMMNGGVEYPRTHSTSPSETYAPYKPLPRIDPFEQPPCLGSTFVSEALRKNAYNEPIGDLDMMEDKVDNPSPKSILQVFLSYEVYTLPVTHLEEVEETIGIPIEVEPFNQTQLEDSGLNTCSHDISFSFREVPKLMNQSLNLYPIFHPWM
ncbi:hypothetical protein Tco_0853551 [Tanacetum coccineum]